MRGPYPGDLRIRVIEFVEAGGSRRDAAEHFEVSASSAIRWLQRFQKDGTFEPMPRGGGVSPLEKYSQQILDLIGEQRDLTLKSSFRYCASDGSLQAAAHCRGSSLAMASPLKKACGRRSASAPTWLARVDAGSVSKAGLIPPASSLSTRQRSPPIWCA